MLVAAALAFAVVGCGSTSPSLVPSSADSIPSGGGASVAPLGSGGPAPSQSDAPSALPSEFVSSGGLNYPPADPVHIGPAAEHGRTVIDTFPAPWTGGRSSEVHVAIYLPPAYDASGGTRYPVIYEAPYGLATWSVPSRLSLPLAMDSLIDSHLVPPEIVVFLATSAGPYLDSECADSFDGRAHIETWIVDTIVPWVDGHFPTIASRVGRAAMGASQGGYCAAALWSHHPDVFGAALIESGYFESGVTSPQTPDAWRPFGGNAAYERSQSPLILVPSINAALRRASLVLIEANPAHDFFGPQAAKFVAVLEQAEVPHRFYADPLGHSWGAFARDTPRMLVELAKWMADHGANP